MRDSHGHSVVLWSLALRRSWLAGATMAATLVLLITAGIAQDEIDDPREAWTDRQLSMAGFALDTSYFEIVEAFPTAIIEETPLRLPFAITLFEIPKIQSIRISIDLDPEALQRSPSARRFLTRNDSLFVSGTGPVRITATLSLTGEYQVHEITVAIEQSGTDCGEILDVLARRFGSPATRQTRQAFWRAQGIESQAVMDVTCQPGRGYRATLSDQVVAHLFQAKLDGLIELELQRLRVR